MNEVRRYLDLMFSGHTGWVSVVAKRGDSWHEKQYAWPGGSEKLWAWATSTNSDVFICPALRINHGGRHKGEGKALWWLWADVDFQDIPQDLHSLVNNRIKQLAAFTVSSGTGDNKHVYVKLTREVTVTEHELLNKGLRDYLHADNKHADNSLLRIPGTENHKQGNPVTMSEVTDRVISPDKLKALPTWRKLTGAADDTWNRTEVTVRGSLRALTRMRGDEATARYGSRHEAVWAVTRELAKSGYSPDDVHTIMDSFPAAIEKKQDEHGAYDVHKDVSRCLARIDDSGVFTEPGPDDVDSNVEAILKRRAAHRQADQIEATRNFTAPPDDVTGTVKHFITHPPVEQPFLIDGIARLSHNVVITAQYKTGKTTFVASNLCRSLVDGVDFLDEFTVAGIAGNVGLWNLEMDGKEIMDDYIRPCGVVNPDKYVVANLRGYGVNVLAGVGKQWAVRWLKDHGVVVWCVDSLARLARMAGVSENENDEMLDLLMAIDEIKIEAGVQSVFIVAHTGRAEMEDGRERARGATAIDDWPDARWVLTADGDTRFLAVDGRNVRLKSSSLVFDPETKRITYGAKDKVAHRNDTGMGFVSDMVARSPGITKNALQRKLTEITGRGRNTIMEWIDEAEECGFIVKQRGSNRSHKYFPYTVRINGGVEPRAFDYTENVRTHR